MITIKNKRSYKGPGVYVGRGGGGMLGNPYSEKEYGLDGCLKAYNTWITEEIQARDAVYTELVRIATIAATQDLILVCWCTDSESVGDKVVCHAQILRNVIRWMLGGDDVR